MKWSDELDGEFNGNPCKIRVGVSEVCICLGGVENGKTIHCDNEIYYALVDGDIINYRRVDLKFRKEIRQPFNIYVPEREYYEYEGALKFILSKLMEAELEEV